MVIPTEKSKEDQTILDTLTELKQTNKMGRNLARALKKLKEGKLGMTTQKVGVMAAILSLPSQRQKKVLLGHWVDLIDGKLV